MRKQKSKLISRESELMQRILEIRYTDIEEEKRLCKQLLDVSEVKQYHYGSAFANVYLVDSHLALGEYSSCDFYLSRASVLCKEYGFDDLMLMLNNVAGLYYQRLNDDQTALVYFLAGKSLAQKLGNHSMLCKIYINIGYSFAIRGDWETGRSYFESAYTAIEFELAEGNITEAVSALSNLAEACIYFGDAEGARQALERCEELSEDTIYNRVRLGSSWCSYYAMIQDLDQCIKKADEIMESDLINVGDQFFIYDMLEGVCMTMLSLGDQHRARQLLELLQKSEYEASLFLQYRILCLEIRYLQQYGEGKQLEQAYRQYYEIVKKVTVIEDSTRAQSMLSKIQINQTLQERETMRRQQEELESASQLDELTGLYNRRYFNKLVTKLIGRADVKSIGFMMLDVDYFKQYNDYYGHFKGDAALRAVAKQLSCHAEEGIYASRYGGDEFVCVFLNLEDPQVEAYAKRIMDGLNQEHILHKMHPDSEILTVSIGYCNEAFHDAMEIEKLLNLADEALYHVKKNNRNGCARKRISG